MNLQQTAWKCVLQCSHWLLCLATLCDGCFFTLPWSVAVCNSYKHFCLRKWYTPAFSLSVCVSDGINACMSYLEEALKSSFLLWFELLMLLHLQLLVLDDALISVSLAEAQHSGYVGPISKPTRGGKWGGALVGRGRGVTEKNSLSIGYISSWLFCFLFIFVIWKKYFCSSCIMWPPTELNQISTMNTFKVAAIKWPQRGRLLYAHSSIAHFIPN